MVLCLLKLIHALPHVLYVECINTCQFSIPSSFWVHTFDRLVASKPCLRSAALALVLRKLGENRSRKAIPRTRAPSTSFLIPKEVKEEVCWRGLPGQKRLSGRKCPMCVRRRLFNNNEWTEHPGNASSQTCCKLLMFNWFVYFVKISFYMIGQAKHAPVVAKAVCQRLNCCLAPQCRDIGATARAARHTSTLITYIQSSRMQLVLVPLLCKHNLLCCSCCSIASAPCHPSHSSHQPQGHWGHGEQAEPSSQTLGRGEGEIHPLRQRQDLGWCGSRWGHIQQHRLARNGRGPREADHLGAMVRHRATRCSTYVGPEAADSSNICPESAWTRRNPQDWVAAACDQALAGPHRRSSHGCSQVVQTQNERGFARPCPTLQKACQSQGQVDVEIAHLCPRDHTQGSQDWSQI